MLAAVIITVRHPEFTYIYIWSNLYILLLHAEILQYKEIAMVLPGCLSCVIGTRLDV